MKIPSAILEELYRHAQESYPSECCGFLTAETGVDEISGSRRCENQQDRLHALDPKTYPRTSRTAYSLSGHDVLFLNRSLDSDQPVRIIYHSHVDVGAYFSAEDKAVALFAGEPAYPVDYLVINAQAGRCSEARLFAFDEGSQEFVETAHYPGQDG